jgi:hypothetical protein
MARQSASKVRAPALRRCATASRQEQEPCALSLQAFSRPVTLMDCQIVDDHHVAFAQGRRQLRLDMDVKRRAGDRTVDDPRRAQLRATQPGDEGVRLPMSEGALARRRRPLRLRPRRRVILVLT